MAGSLHVVGATAWAAVRAVDLSGRATRSSCPAPRVASGRSTVQLARRAGATVIGLAERAEPRLAREARRHPRRPTATASVDRILAAAPDGRVDAFIDTFGQGYVDLAVELGVEPKRIDTIIDWEAAGRVGAQTDGNLVGARPEVLAELADRIVAGELELPIAAVYPLDRGPGRVPRDRAATHARQDRPPPLSGSAPAC